MKLKKIFLAGQEGMVGRAVYKLLKEKKYKIIECKRKDLDLTEQSKVDSWFKKNRPDIVINAAGKVGGILDNSLHKADYLYKNIMIGFNLLNCSLIYNVKKFINLGSVSSYPKITKQPIKEDYLLSSFLEKSNEGYAISKIAVIKYCEYIKNFYKKDFISLQPANLYGIGDNFDLKKSHVIPALIKKFHDAKIKKKESVEIWGSGISKREFLHANDLAQAILFCIKKKIPHSLMNVGSSNYLTIKKLAEIIQKITNYKGRIYFNFKYPDGVPKRKLDNSLISGLGWEPKINLVDGLIEYYKHYKKIIAYKNF